MKYKNIGIWQPTEIQEVARGNGFLEIADFEFKGEKYSLDDVFPVHFRKWEDIDESQYPAFIYGYFNTNDGETIFLELNRQDDGELCVKFYQEEDDRNNPFGVGWKLYKENINIRNDIYKQDGTSEPSIKIDGHILFLKNMKDSDDELEQFRGIKYIHVPDEGMVKVIPYHDGRTYDIYNQMVREIGTREKTPEMPIKRRSIGYER